MYWQLLSLLLLFSLPAPSLMADRLTTPSFYLVFLVSAHHLDYSCSYRFCRTLAKHPRDGSKNGDVGHAWIYLYGKRGGEEIIVEGGHSGELGLLQPRYLDGVMNYVDYG